MFNPKNDQAGLNAPLLHQEDLDLEGGESKISKSRDQDGSTSAIGKNQNSSIVKDKNSLIYTD